MVKGLRIVRKASLGLKTYQTVQGNGKHVEPCALQPGLSSPSALLSPESETRNPRPETRNS
jgi:hypothetical protein